jgi:hypothetical protein
LAVQSPNDVGHIAEVCHTGTQRRNVP